jgi:hypothetical protein
MKIYMKKKCYAINLDLIIELKIKKNILKVAF